MFVHHSNGNSGLGRQMRAMIERTATCLAQVSATRGEALCRWVRDYANFLETEPVAKYARMMGNYVATNVDEQLIAAYLFISSQGNSAPDREKALQVAHYSGVRQRDQIKNGVFQYEVPRQRSLDFTQQCLQVRTSSSQASCWYACGALCCCGATQQCCSMRPLYALCASYQRMNCGGGDSCVCRVG
jgi:hypothetical protein